MKMTDQIPNYALSRAEVQPHVSSFGEFYPPAKVHEQRGRMMLSQKNQHERV